MKIRLYFLVLLAAVKLANPVQAQQSQRAQEAAAKTRRENAEKLSAPFREKSLQMNGVETGQVLTNSIGIRLRRVPAGKFLMGESQSLQHVVTVTNDYFLGVTEVTQAQFEAIMGSNPSHFKGPNHPVDTVSWNDAVEFCKKLSEKESGSGRIYRLPTEAEWEYACRAGRKNLFFWQWDDAMPKEALTDDFVWWRENAEGHTHDVGGKKPNRWGFYDMIGNVWEWCADNYQPGSGYRVLRGGSWYNGIPELLLSSFRNLNLPDVRGVSFGFRCVVEVGGAAR